MQSISVRVAAVVSVCFLVVGVAMWMTAGHSRISDRGYDYALALVSACSRQDGARVKQIAKEVGEAELPDYDRRVILGITGNALKGNWQAASAETRALLNAQILQSK